MTKKARKNAGPPPVLNITGCSFSGPAIPAPSEKMLEAVKAIADASAAHARALEKISEHVAGPPINNVGLSIKDGRVS